MSRALYDYEAQTEDELSLAEDELLRVYESDGVWLLVKKQGNDPLSGGEGRLGYAPANYVDEPKPSTQELHLSSKTSIQLPRKRTTTMTMETIQLLALLSADSASSDRAAWQGR